MEVHASTGNGRARIALSGELDIGTASQLRRAVAEALAQGHTDVLVDLTETTLLDSTGLAALIHAARDVEAASGTMRVVSPPGSEARLVITMSGTARVIGLEDP
jgi:anti-sigma B factor antagonist